jgi:PncC family amidohydrolase
MNHQPADELDSTLFQATPAAFLLAEQVGRLLLDRKLTLALAESCTGGLVGSLVTDVPGSSSYFLGSAVTYAYSAKEAILGVRHETLSTFGAVSAETAAEMARGARRLFGADLAASVTGIAGPDGGSVDKPVGLVHIHLSAPDAEIGERHIWTSDRAGNKHLSALEVLRVVVRYLEARPIGETKEAMSHLEFVNEPISVQARFLPDGQMQPIAFTWRERTRYIADIGRQWQDEIDGTVWRSYLVRSSKAEVFELRFDPIRNRWMLARAWLGTRPVV